MNNEYNYFRNYLLFYQSQRIKFNLKIYMHNNMRILNIVIYFV